VISRHSLFGFLFGAPVALAFGVHLQRIIDFRIEAMNADGVMAALAQQPIRSRLEAMITEIRMANGDPLKWASPEAWIESRS